MDCHGLYKNRYSLQTRIVPPHPWESLADLCQDLYEATVVNSNKKLVVCISCSGQSYKFDVTVAKSASIICAVGISFGLGGFILYKLYCRFIRPLLKKPPKKKKPGTRNDSQISEPQKVDGSGVETNMGNSSSNKPETSAYFSPATGVALHVGRKSRSRDNLRFHAESTSMTSHKQKKRVKRRKASSDKSVPVRVPSSGSDLGQLLYSPSDVSNIDLEGSLKANVSLHSLEDRNMREMDKLKQEDQLSSNMDQSISNLSDPECDRRFSDNNMSKNISVDVDILTNKENCDSTTASNNKFHIELSDDLLTVSSVLLTPPSEDDGHLHPSRHLVLQDVQQPLSSLSSDNYSDSKHCRLSGADESCSCDEKDSVSSLPKLRSPDRFFRDSLLHRLQECHNGAGSSNSSSIDSSPDFSPYARNRKYSIDLDNLSGIATPDSEIFSSVYDVGRSTEDQFDNLQVEVLDIEEEFNSLANKLNELKNIALNSDGSSIEYSPSHPLAKKAVEIVDRTRSKLSRSRSVSVSSTDSSPACSFDMPDMSWDSEGLHGDKTTPNSRRHSDLGSSLRNKLHSKYLFKSSNGHSSILYDSPVESDLEKDGTLDNLSTDDCFEIHNQNDWTKDSSENSDSNHLPLAKPSSNFNNNSAKSGSTSGQNKDSEQASCSSMNVSSMDESSSVYESARDAASQGHVNGVAQVCQTKDSSPHKESNNNGTLQIGEKVLITDYVEREWKGQTSKATTIRKAYEEIPKLTKCNHLCRIRGDNYCGLRGTLFQCLCSGVDICKRWKDVNQIIDKLSTRFNLSSSGLNQWTFANRLPLIEGQRLSLMQQCLTLLFSKFKEAKEIQTQSEREQWTINLLNSNPKCDLYLMEGVKLLMLLNILEMKENQDRGEDVPIFVWLLFARDTSETPVAFVQNHLNTLGDSGGVEQIEMFLLGHTLGIRIQVLRLSQFGQEDFIAYYPDETDNNWSQITLVAEDDRHYNVPVP